MIKGKNNIYLVLIIVNSILQTIAHNNKNWYYCYWKKGELNKKKAVILGLDKVDSENAISFLCKGIILSKLDFKVDVFYDAAQEEMDAEKDKHIRENCPNLTLHKLDNYISDECKKYIEEADILIVNPMPYSINELDYLVSTEHHIYFDLTGLPEYKSEYQLFAKNGYFVFLDNTDILDSLDVLKDIVSKKAKYAAIFDISGSVNIISKKTGMDYISLSTEPTQKNFYFLASIFLAGLIYSLENKYNLSESMRISTTLVDLIQKLLSKSLSGINSEILLEEYKKEFESLLDEQN